MVNCPLMEFLFPFEWVDLAPYACMFHWSCWSVQEIIKTESSMKQSGGGGKKRTFDFHSTASQLIIYYWLHCAFLLKAIQTANKHWVPEQKCRWMLHYSLFRNVEGPERGQRKAKKQPLSEPATGYSDKCNLRVQPRGKKGAGDQLSHFTGSSGMESALDEVWWAFLLTLSGN